MAFRVIVGTVAQCYEALGLIHSLWKPVPGRFKDYIAIPKPNLYQSLHTTVVGPRAERIEIQIRTEEMHRVAEEGVAAHWKYKEKPRDGKGKPGVRASDADQFGWLRQLLEWQKELSDPTEFLETVKVDLFADEVFVFTPKGDVKSLPRGATPLDFAYSVHSEIGQQLRGRQGERQDRPAALPAEERRHRRDPHLAARPARPRTGSPSSGPAAPRPASASTSGRPSTAARWRSARRWPSGSCAATACRSPSSQKDGELDKAAAALGYRIGDDLLVAIGYGKVAPDQLLRLLVPAGQAGRAGRARGVTSRLTEIFRKVARRPAGGVRISGIDDMLVRYGKCCNPVPGDPIVGFITRGRGVTVHTARCEKVLAMDPLRRVDVSWDVKGELKRPGLGPGGERRPARACWRGSPRSSARPG